MRLSPNPEEKDLKMLYCLLEQLKGQNEYFLVVIAAEYLGIWYWECNNIYTGMHLSILSGVCAQEKKDIYHISV